MIHIKHSLALLLCAFIMLNLLPAAALAEDDIILITEEEPALDETDDSEIVIEDDPLIHIVDDDPWQFSGEDEAEACSVFHRYGRLVLDVDWSMIQEVDHQHGGEACACFSLAYCRTILDRRVHQYSEYNIGTVEHAYCKWSLGNYTMLDLQSLGQVYEKLYAELLEGDPVIVKVTGSRALHHYVAVIGFENVVNGTALNASNFLIIDPCAPQFTMENMGYIGYEPKLQDGVYQIIFDNTSDHASFEASKSSYLSLCEFYPSYRTLTAKWKSPVRTLPCSQSLESDSALLVSLAGGESFLATALVENTNGSYWYKGKTVDGTEGYVYAANFRAGKALFSDVTANGLETPYHLDPGYPFYLKGNLRASDNTFSSIRAAVFKEVDFSASPVLSAEVSTDRKFYALQDSTLASKMVFQNLKTGYYTFALTAVCKNYFSTDGKTLQCSEPVITLASQGFTIGDVNTFSVKYDANGGVGAPSAQTKSSGKALTLSKNQPTRDGYRFLGWGTSASAEKPQYQPGDSYTKDAPVILFAIWQSTVEKPAINTAPKSVSAAAGKTVSFTVEASGTDLKYQWYYRTPDGDEWIRSALSSARKPTLTVTAKAYRDGFQYCCRVKNSAGRVYTKAVTLRVQTRPVITEGPQPVTAAAGKTVSFHVSASGTGLTYQWYYRDSDEGSWKKCVLPTATEPVLKLTAKESRDGHRYCCRVKNLAGRVYTKSAEMRVLVKPAITAGPESRTVRQGKTVSFTVKAEGTQLSYQWFYRTSGTGSWRPCKLSSAKSSTLTMTAKSSLNGHQYYCRIMNDVGKVYTKAVVLTVRS